MKTKGKNVELPFSAEFAITSLEKPRKDKNLNEFKGVEVFSGTLNENSNKEIRLNFKFEEGPRKGIRNKV